MGANVSLFSLRPVLATIYVFEIILNIFMRQLMPSKIP